MPLKRQRYGVAADGMPAVYENQANGSGAHVGCAVDGRRDKAQQPMPEVGAHGSQNTGAGRRQHTLRAA